MHSRRITRARRAGATFASADTTIGTLPNGSMTSSNSTAAEKTSAIGIVVAPGRSARAHDARESRLKHPPHRRTHVSRHARHLRAAGPRRRSHGVAVTVDDRGPLRPLQRARYLAGA